MTIALFSATPVAYDGGYERFLTRFHDFLDRVQVTNRIVEGPVKALHLLSKSIGRENTFTRVLNSTYNPNWIKDLKSADIIYAKAEALDMVTLKTLRLSVPLVFGLHTPLVYPPDNSTLLRRIAYSKASLRFLFGRSYIHALGEEQLHDVSRFPNKVFVVSNGVGIPSLRRGSISRNTVLFVGRLTDQKGLDRIHNILALKDPPTVRIAGDGPLEPLIREWDRAGKVTYLGKLNSAQIESEMANAEILIVPSRWEGLPLTVLEALRLGLPVVTSELPFSLRLEKEIDGIFTTDFDEPTRLTSAIHSARAANARSHSISLRAAELFDETVQFGKLHRQLIRVNRETV